MQKYHARGNGLGCAIKRGSTWTAVVTDGFILKNGKLVQKRKWVGGFSTKTAALSYSATYASNKSEKKLPSVVDYWNFWEKGEYLSLSKSKQTAYRIAWNKLECLALIPMNELTINIIQECIDDKAPTYYPAKDMKTVLSHLFDLAVAEGNARTNLTQYLHLPPLNEKEAEPFTEEELKKLWKAYGNGDRIIGCALVMIYTGMMPGELFKLKKDMVNWDKREISGNALKTDVRKKTPMVFPEILEPVLRDLIATSESKQDYVVGMNRWTFYDEYHKSIVAAGVRDLNPYSCRHTTATALALGNIAPSVIQKIMRHSKFSTTQRYIHPDMTAAHAAIGAIG